MAMTRQDIPAYFSWRSGRPRWEPGPTLRARGYKGRDLKDATGAWLTRGRAIDAAEALNKAVKDMPAGELPRAAYERTFTELADKLRATRKFELQLDDAHKGRKKRRLKKKTIDNYKMHLRIIEEWCGDQPWAGVTQKAIENWYDALIEVRGLSMANATMRVGRLALNYAIDKLEWTVVNRFAKIELEEADGRRVLWPLDEIACFVAFADALGLPEFGDAMVIDALVGLRQSDLLAAPRFNLDGNMLVLTAKTGHPARVPVVRQFRERILAGRRRIADRAPTLIPVTEIVSSKTLRPFTDKTDFRETFRLIRLYAAGFAHMMAAAGVGTWPDQILALQPIPEILAKQWGDLRDTSVTMLLRAGCSDAEIATIQGRSLASVKAVIDKHYFVRDDGFARAGADKLEAYLDQANVKW